MKLKWILIALIAVAMLDASPASARKRKVAVAPQPTTCTGTLGDFFRLECPPERRWNGRSPPIYAGGRFIGQDPDPNIRFQILREYYLDKDNH